ncbi:MAG: aspartate aminotransferase family protein [Leptospiraceae bacterium]|nr:aspartate aminotransferase family protein [Leptospiraceae bacterium]MCP5512777.1 aspartate aminotransferase family protein [Leptospiraceae bacterium]
MANSITKTKFQEIKEKTEKFIVGNYSRHEISFEYGVGEYLFDSEGKQYLDFQSGIAVTNLGHSEADIIAALQEQADKLFHTSNLFYSKEQAELAETLIAHSFPGKVFFCNSGTEANEAAFKLARKHSVKKGISNPIILALKGSFHGRSTGAMSMTGQEKVRQGFGDLVSGFHFIQENDIEDLEKAFSKHSGHIAGMIVEPILGEFGVLPIREEFLKRARELTASEGAPLIFDEIQTGMGRTGKLFCFQHYSFTPDIMTLAKGLGSGFPMGAVIIGEKFSNVLEPGSHGTTFGGNHLAAKIGYETIRVLKTRDILNNVPALSEFFFKRLKMLQLKFPETIREVRGIGLHIGVELTIPVKSIIKKCLENGLILNGTNEKVIRILPPLNIGIERIDEAVSIIEKVFEGENLK